MTYGAKAQATGAKRKGTLSLAFWGGNDGEKAGFAYAKRKFEQANPGTHIDLRIAPFDGFFAGIDRGIQSGTAPDLFRVDYTTIGRYSKADVLLDMSPYFTAGEVDAFLPALWEAVKYRGVPFGVPHQTDTSCIVYDKAAFETAGIGAVPERPQDAWTWDEFSTVAGKLRRTLPDNKFPFAFDWTLAGAYRWLSWLYQAGGTLFNADRTEAAIPSAAATKALDYTRSFFDKKWVPGNNTIKTSIYSDNFFLSRTVPMSFVGDFLVPELAGKDGYKGGDWGATFLPVDRRAATDLGGNAIVARKNVHDPDLAAAFLKFLVEEDTMKYFCEKAVELPTLKSLSGQKLDYAYRPDVVSVCSRQLGALDDYIVRESTVAGFADINTALQDQLELAFHGQPTKTTLGAVALQVNRAAS